MYAFITRFEVIKNFNSGKRKENTCEMKFIHGAVQVGSDVHRQFHHFTCNHSN